MENLPRLRIGQTFNFGTRSRLTGIGIAGEGVVTVVKEEREVERETTITRESFHVLGKAKGGIFTAEVLSAYWDDKGVRYRVFKDGVIQALEGMLNRQSELTIIVRGKEVFNDAIGMNAVWVDSWAAK